MDKLGRVGSSAILAVSLIVLIHQKIYVSMKKDMSTSQYPGTKISVEINNRAGKS